MVTLDPGFFSTAPKKLKDEKNLTLKQKTQGFGKFWCNLQQKSTEMTKNKGRKQLKYQNQGQNIQNITEWVQF